MIAFKIAVMALACFSIGFLGGVCLMAVLNVSSKCSRDEEKRIAKMMMEGKL